ncbi:hypothetical protein C8T65DRAFT_740777 [Cerioporus squamosus]|nr:hypothetical protein C8T65DRAFT_740777 [Cerioporus squamosus]
MGNEEEYVVEVRVPDAELMHACAHCGKWEAPGGPRFQRCSGCRARRYCSAECQKDDRKQQWHKGECSLLKKGKFFEAERRRRLHDNDWWMSSAMSDIGSFGDLRGAERSVAWIWDMNCRIQDLRRIAQIMGQTTFSTMEHPKEPVMDDAAIAPFLDQPVAAIILWCTSGRPRHWITSYEFQQLLVSEKNTRTPVLRAVASA